MNHWLVKSEPETYSFAQLVADKHTDWTGVRNYQARNFLREMKPGDKVLYYHSGKEKAVVGTATVSRAAFPDPTADPGDKDWSAVELRPGKPLPIPVSLADVRTDPRLSKMFLLTHSRLSVQPVTREEYDHIFRAASTGARPA